jgi:hypothetical protein
VPSGNFRWANRDTNTIWLNPVDGKYKVP